MINTISNNYYVEFDILNSTQAVVNISAPSKEEINSINNLLYAGLSYFDSKSLYTWEYDEGFTDGVVYVYNKVKQTIPIGLIPRATKYLQDRKSKLKIRVSDKVNRVYRSPNGVISTEYIAKYMESLNIFNRRDKVKITPYEHQIKLVHRALNNRRASLLACTSAGKSLSMYGITRYLMEVEKKKILVIVPSTNLVEQLYSDFYDDYGWDDAESNCTLIHGDSKDKLTEKQKRNLQSLQLGEEVMLKSVTISTWQSLQNKPDEFFKVFTAVIVDEAHGTRGAVLRDILDKCINATDFKIGLSGTLPTEGLDAAWVEGALGRKIDIVRLKELVDKGILTPVEVISLIIPYSDTVRSFVCNKNYKEEYSLITNNGSRKKVMDLLITTGKITTDENTVMLYKSKSTLADMHKYLSEKYPQFKYHIIQGDIETNEREKIRKEMENSTGNIIIATYGTMKQGVNIKLLHNLIFAEFSKSMYEVVQSIGRIVRPHKMKKLARVFDICDNCSYYTKPRNGGMPRLKENYAMQHYRFRKFYFQQDDIPVTELDLTGIMEGTVDPDCLKEKKEAASKAVSKKKKSATTSGTKNKKSQFI